MPTVPQLTLTFADAHGPEQVVPALKILLLLTVLSIAPAILISMTAFTRIVIVMSFVRQALGAQNVPPMQVVMALSFRRSTRARSSRTPRSRSTRNRRSPRRPA